MGSIRLAAVVPLLGLACGYATDTEQQTVEVRFERAKQEFEGGHYFDAVLKFSDFIREHPGSVLVDQAIYFRGRSYFEQKDWVMSSTDFDRVVRDFPESRFACDAEFWLSEAYWRQSRKPPYDQYETQQAISEFERFMIRCPDHELAAEALERIARARDRLAEKQYRNAALYRRLKQLDAELVYLGLVIDDYAGTRWATRARQDRVRALLRLLRIKEARSDLEWLRDHDAADPDLIRAFERTSGESVGPNESRANEREDRGDTGGGSNDGADRDDTDDHAGRRN